MFLTVVICLPGAALPRTPAPAGPYRVEGNRILDAAGRPYLIRGTSLPALSTNASDIAGAGQDFGALSATSLVTIRQRLNMNAVRLPVMALEYESSEIYRARVEGVVRMANQFELLVILGAEAATEAFWTHCAARFRDNPNVFFAPGEQRFTDAIRSSGAQQPVIVRGLPSADRNVIYETTPAYSELRTDQDRHAWFESLAARAPVLVSGLDPRLNEDSAECEAFPRDPGEASQLVEDNLTYFDAHNISWVIASFRPGSLITDYHYYNGTKLDDGWTCGKSPGMAGLGLLLLSHLWNSDPHGLFAVSPNTGSYVLPRGGMATAYGPILAEREMGAGPGPLPKVLGNVSVRITDSRGVARLAPLLHTGAGWAFLSFVVPPDSAIGPAEVSVVRTDGSSSVGKAIIADTAPGLSAAGMDGRGAVTGEVLQRFADGKTKTFHTAECSGYICRTLPIPLSRRATTTVRLEGTGFRNAARNAAIRVTIGGVSVPVVSFGPAATLPGRDQLTIKLPDSLIGYGEADLFVSVDGVWSNIVRINCGSASPTAPRGFPQPRIPPGNPMNEAKVTLGRYLFYDRRMSVNGETSCATCHRQELAFTDGRARAVGATGQLHPRSAMTVVNVAYNAAFNWSNPGVHSLEEQALKPMYSTSPVELGFGAIGAKFIRLIRSDATYRPLFPRAFPSEPDPYTVANIAKALAAFERTIISAASPYDRFHYQNDQSAISEAAKRGEILFFLDGGPSCFRCHGGFNFSDAAEFHNTGLYNPYPAPNLGLFEHTGRRADIGKFKAPTLRNIALTAPYMHDGSIATLEEVLDHYAAGGRSRDNPDKDKLVHGFPMTPQNRADLVAFLKSLTDESLLHDAGFADPWRQAR